MASSHDGQATLNRRNRFSLILSLSAPTSPSPSTPSLSPSSRALSSASPRLPQSPPRSPLSVQSRANLAMDMDPAAAAESATARHPRLRKSRKPSLLFRASPDENVDASGSSTRHAPERRMSQKGRPASPTVYSAKHQLRRMTSLFSPRPTLDARFPQSPGVPRSSSPSYPSWSFTSYPASSSPLSPIAHIDEFGQARDVENIPLVHLHAPAPHLDASLPPSPVPFTPIPSPADDNASVISGIPLPPSAAELRRARLAKLTRHLGEPVPAELVLTTSPPATPATPAPAPESAPAPAPTPRPNAARRRPHPLHRLSLDMSALLQPLLSPGLPSGASKSPASPPPPRRELRRSRSAWLPRSPPAGGDPPRPRLQARREEAEWLAGARDGGAHAERPMTPGEKALHVRRAKKMAEVRRTT